MKILEVYEQRNILNVKVETSYGIETLGLGINKKYLDPETDQPLWRKEVRKLLEAKYGSLDNRLKKDLVDAIPIINKPMTLDEFSPIVEKSKIKINSVPVEGAKQFK